MAEKNKVAIIVCYYGPFPKWMDLWLRSCEKNSDGFDFFIVTDNEQLYDLPYNVKVLNMTLEQLKNRFSNVLKKEVCLDNPYKLCDYKPLYGLAFENEMKEYDFWGHCDLDMIFGDLRSFITDDVLASHERIGSYGHLTIYRNLPKLNNLYKCSGSIFSYNKVFFNKENYGFDEFAGMNLICKTNNVQWYKNLKVADAGIYNSRIRLSGHIGIPELFFWDDGKIGMIMLENGSVKVDEYAYLHFSGKKPIVEDDVYTSESFYITDQSFKKRNKNSNYYEELKSYAGDVDKEKEIQEFKKMRKTHYLKILHGSFKDKYIWLMKQIGIRRSRKEVL